MGRGMFEGVRVVELAQYVFVPGAGVLLADQGAEVIKVESVGTGDPYRSLKIGDGRELRSVNLAMEQNNHSKKSIAIDLKNPAGRDAFLALISTADVFLTSLRPKALRGLKLEVDDLRAANPKLIYVRGNGLGFRGAEADKAGFDGSSFWARGGMAYALTPPGQPLTPPRPALGDHSGSVALAFGVASALFKRATTGEPSVVETSLLSTALWMLSSDIGYSQSPDYTVHHPQANRFPLMSAYATQDGRLVQLMLLDPEPHWPSLCHLLDREELAVDPLFANNAERMKNTEALVAIIGAAIKQKTWNEWRPIFEAWNAPWELIRSVAEVYEDPQVLANDMIGPIVVGDASISIVSGPVSFDGQTHTTTPKAAPSLGEHSEELLVSAGFTSEQISALKAAGAVQ